MLGRRACQNIYRNGRRRKGAFRFIVNLLSRNAFALADTVDFGPLGGGFLFEDFFQHRFYPLGSREHDEHGDDEERQTNGAGKEGSDVAVGKDQGTAQILVQHVAQDNAEHQGRHGIVHFPQDKSDNAEEHHDAHVEKPGLQREGSHHAEYEDDRHELLPGHLENLDHGADHGEA
ncbi:hypothetical protein SDC9_16270 [bioreactor metagenome]|uniref:Uncharacterized protein n=1 Tax=bioreactor metagenome TaxID=1076179 RepID=A0A644TU70_9ZZZZ